MPPVLNLTPGDPGLPTTPDQIAGLLKNLGNVYLPDGITNLAAAWDTTYVDQLNITWTFDTTALNNQYLSDFQITFVTPQGTQIVTTQNINKSSSSQSYNLTKTNNQYLFGQFHGTSSYPFTSISVVAQDQFGNVGASATLNSITPYSSGLPTPVIVTTGSPATGPITNGYQVVVTYQVNGVNVTPPALPSKSNFSYLQVQEWVDTTSSITSSSNIPVGATWVPVSLGILDPVTIYSSDTNWRWIRAYFTDSTGSSFSSSSAIYGPIKPTPVAVVNTTPPTDVVSASATFNNSGVGSDIIVSFTLPATNYGESFIVKLVPTAAPGLSGQFYYFPTGLSGSQVVSFTVSKSSIFAQFGAYYSTYTGTVYSVSALGNISQATVSSAQIPSFSHTNALAGITPTFTVSSAANGYTVSWQNYSGSTYAHVYESATPFTSDPVGEANEVYAGSSPVTIQSLNYNTRYIIIRLYDDYGNHSNYSDYSVTDIGGKKVVPYNPGLLSLISNPVAFQTNGSILAGSYNSSTGSLSSPNVIFNTAGIYATDASGTTTTQIINNAGSQATTFITQRAQIADWTISPQKIENTLYGSSGSSTYVGLSGSAVNGYSIWAGSPTAGGSSNANFTVTPSGYVTAKNISIIGNGSATTLINAGGLFTVSNTGLMTATAATITGTLTINGGSTFAGNVSIAPGASVYARTTGPGSGQGVVFNYNGLSAYDSAGAQTTSINAGAASGQPTFTTTNALVGSWNVTGTTIQNAVSPSLPTFLLNSSTASTANSLQIYDSNRSYLLQLQGGVSGSTSNVLFAGPIGAPNFSVSAMGTLTATGATIKANNNNNNVSTMTIDSTGLTLYNSSGNQTVSMLTSSGAVTITGSLNSGKTGALDVYPNSASGFFFDGSSGSNRGQFAIGGNSTSSYIQWDGSKITLYSAASFGSYSAYAGNSQITLDSTGTKIKGMPVQGNFTQYQAVNGGTTNYTTVDYNSNNPTISLGSYSRQRMLVEDAYDGVARLGLAIYYSKTSDPLGLGAPYPNSGYIGDLWVVY
jgi:hypothetical protein